MEGAHGVTIDAADVTSAWNLPPFDNSAMDGFALRAEDSAGAPAILRVIGTVPAGSAADRAVGRLL